MASFTETLGEAGMTIPSISFEGSSYLVVYILIGILVMGALFVAVYLLISRLKFNKKVVVFRKIGGKVIPAITDSGKMERVGMGGDFWMITRKLKKVISRPRIEIAKNVYWFYERDDGEWINFSVEDIDAKQHEAKAYYVDEDMRLQRLGIQRNLKERLSKINFWEKYGAMIMYVVFIIIVTICLIIIFNKINELTEALISAANAITTLSNSVTAASQCVQGGLVSQ